MTKRNNLICYLNGHYLPLKQAGVSPLDLGFLRGYALLEVMRTYQGQIFCFSDHYQRLTQGAKILHLRLPLTANQLEQVIYRLINLNNLPEAKIKIVLSGGIGKDDLVLGPKPTLFLGVESLHLYPSSWYQTGVKLVTLNYERPNPDLKLTNYVEAIRYHDWMVNQKAAELLYVNRGLVLECATSNIFFFKNNTLITPREGVLGGVTRKVVIKLAKKRFPVSLRTVSLKELLKADEVFITSTTREILPVVQINKVKIKNGQVGEKTRILSSDFQNFLQKNYFTQ